MFSSRIGDIIHDLKLSHATPARVYGRSPHGLEGPGTATAIGAAIVNVDTEWECFEGSGQVVNSRSITVVKHRSDEVIPQARRDHKSVIELTLVIWLGRGRVKEGADVAAGA